MISIGQKNNLIACFGKLLVVSAVVFVFMASNSNAYNEKSVVSSKGYYHGSVYVRGSDGAVIKRHFASGTVNVIHQVGMNSSSTTVAPSTNINFSYTPTSFTFNANGASWDTPNGVWYSNINQNRKTTSFNPIYWQKFWDTAGGGRYGEIAFSGLKPTGTYITSNNNSIISCSSMKCVANSDGTAIITAHIPATLTRIWSYITYSTSTDWVSEHFTNPSAVNDVNTGGWMFCPTTANPVNNNINYCTNKLTLPAKTVSWTITVATAKTNPTAKIEIPASASSSYANGANVSFQGQGILGTGGGSLGYYMWVDVNPGTPSYNGTRCSQADGNTLNYGTIFDANNRTSFTTNTLSTGTHRVCFNVRQDYPDGTRLWAGAAGNIEYRDISILPPAPIVDLKINTSDGPITVNSGDNLNITWGAVNNATSCAVTSGAGWNYSPPSSPSITGGSDNVSATADSTYTLQCTGPGGVGSNSVQVTLCVPDYAYTCTSTDSVDCNNPSNCGLTNNPTNSCLVSDNNSCVAPTT
ncbi:MAG TPA: hypothetical protein ENJ27_00935, partial [Candidatus Moranbacteria bacterium]|nr:hypothetical protein [Candidatus Moranbacteria bacterium]